MSRLRERTADLIQQVIGEDWVIYPEEIRVCPRNQHTDMFAFEAVLYHKTLRDVKNVLASWSTMTEIVKQGSVKIIERKGSGLVIV